MSFRVSSNQVRKRVSQDLTIPPSISFLKVTSHSPYFQAIKSAFETLISPVYGNQNAAIEKIRSGKDRTCEVMLYNNIPKGLIVYKNKLQNEYGLLQALELKTLFLLNPNSDSGQGFGSLLFRRIDDVAIQLEANTIYCTASTKVEPSIQCALKNGYKIAKTLTKPHHEAFYLLMKKI